MSGIIYKITCNETGDIYVGSTTQSLTIRMRVHKSKCKAVNEHRTHFQYSSIIINKNNFTSEILESVNFGEDKKLLLLKEREWMEKLKPINKMRPIVLNKEEAAKFKKEYNQANPELIKIQKHNDYIKHKDQILEKNAEWRNDNRDHIAEYNKNQYQKNKLLMSEKGKEKIICSCGAEISRSSKSNHIKSAFHLKSFNN
jgi:hypothetical protein